MANLKVEEFNKVIEFLAEDHGLQSFRDKLVRLNALETRRKAGAVSRLAHQLYTLTGGLRREVPATVAIHSLWAEQVNGRLGEDGEKELEKIAEQINECLGDRDRILDERSEEIVGHIRRYEERLAAAIGSDRARVDMILKAVPDVADKLRGMPPVDVPTAAVADAEPPAPAES
jgi:hypothetical protein